MDATNSSLIRLRETQGFVFDMDGTLVLGDKQNKGLKALPGAVAFVRHLEDRGVPFVFLTNGTSRPPAEYGAIMRDLGFPIADRQMMTPASVAAEYLKRQGFKRVMVLGCKGVSQPLADIGLDVLPAEELDGVEAIFVGWHRDFCVKDLEAACHAVWGGAKLYTSSLAPFFATAGGRALGTSRAIVSMVRSITGCKVKVLGKPAPEAMSSARRKLGKPAAKIAVVGDDPGLEIPMALRAGSLAVAVASGIGGRSEFTDLPLTKQPNIIVDSVQELFDLYLNSDK